MSLQIAVAVRIRGLDAGVQLQSSDDAARGALLNPSLLAEVHGSAPNAPSGMGYVALDGLSKTVFVLGDDTNIPLPEGWHVFRATADARGLEAMMLVARSLGHLSTEDEATWRAWKPMNP